MKSLAVKYRPKTFDDVVGQQVIKDILQEQIRTKTHQNCYLFTGGAGTGKTTCARIFGNELNGGRGNLIEIDAASNNGVENVREIKQQASNKSLNSEYKVYIIDECHMLSTGAWNALLKLFEEPPASTIFILCTTDPQKIPATILSRVQRYDFQRIPLDLIINRMKEILYHENQTIEVQGSFIHDYEALEYIAKLADGGMRDAITLMDKCISHSPNLTIENVTAALGTVNYETMVEFMDNLLYRRSNEIIQNIESIYYSGMDIKQFMKEFGNFVLDFAKYQINGSFDYISIPSFLEETLKEWAKEFNKSITIGIMNNIIKINNDIKWEGNAKLAIEAALLLYCEEH